MKQFKLLLILTIFLVTTGSTLNAANKQVPTMPVSKLEKGMTGYGKTVFRDNTIDTFDVRVLGILNNVMPDQDMILIRAKKDLLQQTKIMSGMSGSPIYINGKLVGALAYSWPYEKEPLAGVTPIDNILNAGRRPELSPGQGKFTKIQTPLVASGLSGNARKSLKKNLKEHGVSTQIMTGGTTNSDKVSMRSESRLVPGSAVGAKLMSGDLNLTAIGTVTHRTDDRVYAFGHPFMNAGRIEFPMTTAFVHTYMPSLRSSFKIASPRKTVGTIVEDRQAAIVGQFDYKPNMIPINIDLSIPSHDFNENYSVNVVRNRFLSPGLINLAASNFAQSKINQLGINRLKSTISVTFENHKDLQFSQSSIVSGSFNPWAFIPLSQIWSNRFDRPEVEQVSIDLTLVPEQDSARIDETWVNKSTVKPGEKLTVFTRIKPFRSESKIRTSNIRLPSKLKGGNVKITVVPASMLSQLEASPVNLDQLINRYNSIKSPSKLATLLQFPAVSMKASGHRMDQLPLSIAGAYEILDQSKIKNQPSSIQSIKKTDWILSGQKSVSIQIDN